MERIVFLDRDTIRVDVNRPAFPHEWVEFAETSAGDIVERLRGATIAITNKVRLREPDLTQLPELKFIAVCATGVDIVDLESCRRRGIAVSNVRAYSRDSVPEHALMLMLALRRSLMIYRDDVECGAWERSKQFCLLDHPIHDLAGSTLGIVGYGTLGQRVERLALAFEMRILIAERKAAGSVRPGRTSFDDVLRSSDILSLHVPLTEETRTLIGRRELGLMKRTAILINTARGGLVDEAALAGALRSGGIAGAGFDVLTGEPPRDGNPLLDLHLPNFILTPHVAWASREAMRVLVDQVIENIEAFTAGSPRNLVT